MGKQTQECVSPSSPGFLYVGEDRLETKTLQTTMLFTSFLLNFFFPITFFFVNNCNKPLLSQPGSWHHHCIGHAMGRQVILAGPKCRIPGPEVSYRYEAQFSGLQVLSQTITAWDTQYRLSTQRCSMRLEIVPSRNTEQTCSSLTASDRTAVYFANKVLFHLFLRTRSCVLRIF